MSNYGFIITRHVNSEKTNRYWNQNVKLIRYFYPYKKIVIIDDNSDQSLVKADFDYKNIEIINSEYPGRGELLPYIYFYRNKWFDSAIIIHDSVFIHKRIDFSKFKVPVLPLWHFPNFDDDIQNTIRIISSLKNSNRIMESLNNPNYLLKNFNENNWCGVFGCQSYIKHDFLSKIFVKYDFNRLIGVVIRRIDRCSLERLFGVIFYREGGYVKGVKSLFGNILSTNWGYTYDDYINAFNEKRLPYPWVKVWTGR